MAGPEQFFEMMQSMFGTARYRTPEDYLWTLRNSRPDERAQWLDYMLLTVGKGDPNAYRNMKMILMAENDMGKVDFGVLNETIENHGVDALFGMEAFLLQLTDQKGYADYQEVRRGLGKMKEPAILAMPAVLGVHELPVRLEGELANRKLSLNFADILGHIAYRQEMTDLYMARDTNKYVSAVLNMGAEVMAKKLGVSVDKVKTIWWTDSQTAMGNSASTFGQLRELMSTLFFGAEAFLNVPMDAICFSQSVAGAVAQEHARSEYGIYYELYEKENPQAQPESNLTYVFDGLLSRYSKKGLKYIWDHVGYTEVSWSNQEREKARLCEEAMRDVMTYEAKTGEADIIEADFVLNKLGRGGNTAEDMIAATEDIDVTAGLIHLRSPDLWEARAELYADDRWDAFSFDELYEKMFRYGGVQEGKIQSLIDKIPAEKRIGIPGYRRFIKEAAAKGVAVFNWNEFNARDLSDVIRYGEKVAGTTKALVGATDLMDGSGGSLSPIEMKHKKPNMQLRAYRYRNIELIKQGVGTLEKSYYEGIYLAYIPGAPAFSVTEAWLKGLMRVHCVPRLNDNETLLVDIDYDSFVKNKGKTTRPNRIRREDVGAMFSDESARKAFDQELAKAGCRWATDNHYGTYLIGGSGRPLFRAATAQQQYKRFGDALSRIRKGEGGSLSSADKQRIESLGREYNAITRLGHNRFSINWVMGYCSYGTADFGLVIEGMENAGLIQTDQKDTLHRKLSMLVKRGVIGATNDRELPLAPPSTIKPRQYGKVVGWV